MLAVPSLAGTAALEPEVRTLIATMARENPQWGTERIRGELLKHCIAVSARSIRRYRRRGPARPRSQSWRTFLANHAQAIWAADLFVVQTLTFGTLYILPLNEREVRAVLTEFVAYYNQDRPHGSLGLETPVARRRPVDGKVVSRPALGGLHHVFERAA